MAFQIPAWLCLTIAGLLYYTFQRINSLAIAKYTRIYETKQVNTPCAAPKLDGRAVVIGGSIAGLASAAVLASHYEKVLLIDEEPQTSESTIRPRVGQLNQIHILGPAALGFWRRFFPTFDQELEKAGMRVCHVAERMYMAGGYIKSDGARDCKFAQGSRAAFETVVRNLVMAKFANIEVVSGSVTGLQEDRPGFVSIATLRNSEGGIQPIEGSIFVDCTGAHAAGIKWISKLGYPVPEIATYDAHITYTNFTLKPSKEAIEQERIVLDRSTFLQFAVPTPNSLEVMSVSIMVEDGKLLVCFVDIAGHRDPPETKADVIQDLKETNCPNDVKKALLTLVESCEAEQFDKRDTYSPKEFNINRYDQVDRLPHNLVAVGDACLGKLNPIFGQGMGKAVGNAAVLDSLIREHRFHQYKPSTMPVGFSKRYYQKVLPADLDVTMGNYLFDKAWQTTDPLPNTTLAYSKQELRLLWFIGQILLASHVDPKVGVTFHENNQRQISPLTLFMPNFLARVAYARYTGKAW